MRRSEKREPDAEKGKEVSGAEGGGSGKHRPHSNWWQREWEGGGRQKGRVLRVVLTCVPS